MTEPVITTERAVDSHQKAVLAKVRGLGVEPATVGVYGTTGQEMRTVVILYSQADIETVAALGEPWRLKLPRWTP